MNTYTIICHHADYNVSKLEVTAENTTEALIKALKYYRTNKLYLQQIVSVEIEGALE